MPYGIIYVITNTVNGKQYVGQTTLTLSKRWSYHVCAAFKNPAQVFLKAIVKYGPDSFSMSQLATAESEEELNQKETHYIAQLNSIVPNGYNLTTGGDRFKHTKETRKKISDAGRGRIVSEETRRKISDHQKGKIRSEEDKKKTSIATLASMTPEVCAKISAAKKGKHVSAAGKASHAAAMSSPEVRAHISESRIRGPKPYCQRGHAMTKENIYTFPNGKRACRACRKQAKNRWMIEHGYKK